MFSPTISIEQLTPGNKTAFTINDINLMIANVNGTIYATQKNCTHADEDLTEGHLEGSIIECPVHGAMFDIIDGRTLSLPAVPPLKTYPAKIENGIILVDVPELPVAPSEETLLETPTE